MRRMKPIENVPLPERMKHLPRDRRGYPIPVTVMRDRDNMPHFTINDESIRHKVILNDLCPICGGKLLRGRWSVGGPASAFHEHGAYYDPPGHYECLAYALQVCPYLAVPSYGKRIDTGTLKDPQTYPIMFDVTQIAERPDPFVMVMHIGQKVHFEFGLPRSIRPNRPYRRVEYWSNGVKLEDEEGQARAMAYLEEAAPRYEAVVTGQH